jgi:Ser/Thr protein kinase RdoA (MazF antagonist)
LNTQLFSRILARYGLPAGTSGPPEKGYRNESHAYTLHDGQTLNFVLYKREPGILTRIQNANRVANYLAGRGFPARRTFDTRILRLQAKEYLRYGSLYEYLPGTTIPWEAYTMKHLKLLGEAMSNMHALLAGQAQEKLPSVIAESQALLGRMQTYLGQPSVQNALRTKLGATLRVPAFDFSVFEAYPQQPLHMDFVRSNILFDNTPALTGVIDFEKAAYGPPVFDIARTLAFLLVDCKYKPEEKIRKYFLISGYNKRGRASFTTWGALDHLVTFFLLHDFYKFLRHNPYESLNQNMHFVRTKMFLNARGLI